MPFLWYTAISIGQLYDHPIHQTGKTKTTALVLQPPHVQALTWHSRAVSTLRQQFTGSSDDDALAILSCIPLVSIELQCGSDEAGFSLLRRGFSLVCKFLSTESLLRPPNTSLTATVERTVLPFLTRHALTLAPFTYPPFGPVSSTITVRNNSESGYGARSTVYVLFKTLHPLLHRASELTRALALILDQPAEQPRLVPACTYTLAELTSWHAAATAQLESHPRPSVTDTKLLHLALLYHHVAYIALSIATTTSEMAYDTYMPMFASLIEHAQAEALPSSNPFEDVCSNSAAHIAVTMTVTTNANMGGNLNEPIDYEDAKDLRKHYFPHGASPALFFATTRCRHPGLRRKALELLLLQTHQHRHHAPRSAVTEDTATTNSDSHCSSCSSIWDMMPVATLAEAVVRFEEAGLMVTEDLPTTDHGEDNNDKNNSPKLPKHSGAIAATSHHHHAMAPPPPTLRRWSAGDVPCDVGKEASTRRRSQQHSHEHETYTHLGAGMNPEDLARVVAPEERRVRAIQVVTREIPVERGGGGGRREVGAVFVMGCGMDLRWWDVDLPYGRG